MFCTISLGCCCRERTSLFYFLFFEVSKPSCFSCSLPCLTFSQLSSHPGGLCFACSNKSGYSFLVQGSPGLDTRLQVQPWQCWLRGESSPPWSCWLHPCRHRPEQSWLLCAALWATSCVGCKGCCSLLSAGCPPGLQLIFLKSIHFYPFGPQPALVHGLLPPQLQEYLGFGIDSSKRDLLL